MPDYMEILGEQVVREIGFEWTSLINPVANVAKTGVDQYQQSEAAKKAKRDSDEAVARSIQADKDWANAEANLTIASIDPTTAAAAQVLRDSAMHDAQKAGAALQGDGIDKRCKAAHDSLNAAATAASTATKDKQKQALFHAWQKVAAACNTAASSSDGASAGDDKGHAKKPESGSFIEFLTQKKAGLPVYAWAGIGAVGLTVVGMLLRRRK